jgi:hypothetical protein
LRRAWLFWAIALATLVLLTLPLAAWLWDLTGLGALLTYPWQVLALTGPPLAFLAGSAVTLDRQLARYPAWAAILAFVVLASTPYLTPLFTQVDPGPQPVAMFRSPQAGGPGGLEVGPPQWILLETEIAPPAEITPTLTLTLTWQAVTPVVEDYTVFVHVLRGDDKVAQRDMRPCDGECPTHTWQPGTIVVDRHEIPLAAGAPSGPYRLATGLYRLDTGERAIVLGREDGTVVLDVP